MTDINKLIKKYYRPDGKNPTGNIKLNNAEIISNEYDQQLKTDQRRKHRHLLLDQLLNEIPFKLQEPQISQIRYWIDTFNPYWKQFHRQASDETILLAFIMVQRKQTNKRLKINRFSISRKYHLTNPVFITIQNQLIFQLMRTTPMVYTQSKYYNHEIIEKGQQR